jgi:hypothetical protein
VRVWGGGGYGAGSVGHSSCLLFRDWTCKLSVIGNFALYYNQILDNGPDQEKLQDACSCLQKQRAACLLEWL